MGILDKILGNQSEKEIKRISHLVDAVMDLDEEMQALSDDELRAKTDEFKDLAHKLAMQVASMNPQWVSEADIPAAKMKEAEKEAEASLSGKEPADKKKQIIASKVSKAFADRVLMSQPYIFDDKKTVADLIKETIAKTGENINVKQFKRIELGVTE